MRWFSRWYGAGPLHLLTMIGCAALAGYAVLRFPPHNAVGIAAWFAGAVIGHDLVLVPLYTLADRSVTAVFRHRAGSLPAVPGVNYVRVPAGLSGLLLLIWFPLILRLPPHYTAATTLPVSPYLWHWLAVTGALFLLSAALFALRLRPRRRLRAALRRQQRLAAAEPGGARQPPGYEPDRSRQPDQYEPDPYPGPGSPTGDWFPGPARDQYPGPGRDQYPAPGRDQDLGPGRDQYPGSPGYPPPGGDPGGSHPRPGEPGRGGSPWPQDRQPSRRPGPPAGPPGPWPASQNWAPGTDQDPGQDWPVPPDPDWNGPDRPGRPRY